MNRFLVSFLIFLFAWLPVFFVSLPITAMLLLTKWDGHTTWFGNYLHGRKGNMHMPPNPGFWQQFNFLAIRNPISNFGKFTLSRGSGAWLEQKTWGRVGVLYGWKLEDPRLPHNRRPFIFRPFFK